VEAAKVAPLDPLPPEVLAQFGQIYGVEQEARQTGMAAAQRLALRQQKTVPLMAALKERVVAIRQQIVPGSTLAKACDYLLNQWSRLEVFLQDGRLEADNNWCEGGLRPLVLGRNYPQLSVMRRGVVLRLKSASVGNGFHLWSASSTQHNHSWSRKCRS